MQVTNQVAVILALPSASQDPGGRSSKADRCLLVPYDFRIPNSVLSEKCYEASDNHMKRLIPEVPFLLAK